MILYNHFLLQVYLAFEIEFQHLLSVAFTSEKLILPVYEDAPNFHFIMLVHKITFLVYFLTLLHQSTAGLEDESSVSDKEEIRRELILLTVSGILSAIAVILYFIFKGRKQDRSFSPPSFQQVDSQTRLEFTSLQPSMDDVQ